MKTTLTFLTMLIAVPLLHAQNSTPQPVKKTTHLGVVWGYENANGEMVIPARYKQAYAFENGVARVKASNDLFGLINEKGEELLPLEYDHIDRFEELGSGNQLYQYNAAVVRKKIRTEESKNRHKYYQPVSTPLPGENRKDYIILEGAVNTNGEFIIPLAEHHINRNYQLFLLRFAKDEHRNYQAVLDDQGKIVIDPVLAKIEVTDRYISLFYTKALSIEGSEYKYDVSELYDLSGNLLVAAERGYDRFNGWDGNSKFFQAGRDFVNRSYYERKGLVNARGEEVLPTIYSYVNYQYDTKLYQVKVDPGSSVNKEVFFYVNDDMECIEKPDAPCPEPLDDSFDYQGYLGTRKVKPNFKVTTPLPWEKGSSGTSAMAVEKNTTSANSRKTGTGPVFKDMNDKWVEYPPQNIGGHVIMLNDIQMNAECGNYEWITNNSGGREIQSRATLECIHAGDLGYIFKINYSLKPDWYRHNPGERYLHVMKKEKNGNVKYKYQIMVGEFDTSFSKNKMGYTSIRSFSDMGSGGWWNIAFQQ